MIGSLSGVLTLILMILFIGIWIWAWSSRNKAKYEAMSRLPLEDNDDTKEVRDAE